MKKKRSEETQILRAGCSKAEPIIFAPPQTPFPGVRDGQNLISWRWSLPLPTNPVWWGSIHAISSYRGNRPTHTPTHRQDRLQVHCAAASAQCNDQFLPRDAVRKRGATFPGRSRTVPPSAIKFGMVTHMGRGVFRRSATLLHIAQMHFEVCQRWLEFLVSYYLHRFIRMFSLLEY